MKALFQLPREGVMTTELWARALSTSEAELLAEMDRRGCPVTRYGTNPTPFLTGPDFRTHFTPAEIGEPT